MVRLAPDFAVASGCSCGTLEVCALFETDPGTSGVPGNSERSVTLMGGRRDA